MKKLICSIFVILLPLLCSAQKDRREVRAGNRDYRKGNVREAEIDYRKAVLKDSSSFAGQYNLASSLYRSQDYEGASKALSAIEETAVPELCAPTVKGSDMQADCHFNAGDVALQKKDYAAAVKAFRSALLLNPGDLEAKENYIYAKKMLENQQDGGGGQNQDQDQDQDQNQDQNQDQDQSQDQNQDQDRDGQQPQEDRQNPSEQKISPQQAQQMLKAIQAKEKETQDKVKQEKAALLQSKQKDKNW